MLKSNQIKKAVKPRSHESKHYVNNKEFYNALKDYSEKCRLAREQGKEEPRASDYIGKCIMLICEKYSTAYNFVGYSYRDEMYLEAILTCSRSIKNFNCDKYFNPVAFFSQIAFNSMVQIIKDEKIENYVKFKNAANNIDLLDVEMLDGVDIESMKNYDEVSSKIINEFEDFDRKQREKAKKPKKVNVEIEVLNNDQLI